MSKNRIETLSRGVKGDEVDNLVVYPVSISPYVFLMESRIGMGYHAWLYFSGSPTGRLGYLITFLVNGLDVEWTRCNFWESIGKWELAQLKYDFYLSAFSYPLPGTWAAQWESYHPPTNYGLTSNMGALN